MIIDTGVVLEQLRVTFPGMFCVFRRDGLDLIPLTCTDLYRRITGLGLSLGDEPLQTLLPTDDEQFAADVMHARDGHSSTGSVKLTVSLDTLSTVSDVCIYFLVASQIAGTEYVTLYAMASEVLPDV